MELKITNASGLREVGQWVIASSMVGVCCGLASVLYYYLLERSTAFFAYEIAHFFPPAPGGEFPVAGPQLGFIPWRMVLAPTLGGLVAGLLYFFFAKNAQRSGTDMVIESFHKKQGSMHWRLPTIKSIAAIFVIGSGGSVGREGPMVQVGSLIGQSMHGLVKGLGLKRRTLLLAGAAGGFASIFRAPLSGAVFATEVLYREPDFEYDAFVPALISAIVAFITFGFFYSWDPIFSVDKYVWQDPRELLLFAVFGVVCALGGIAYVNILKAIKVAFDRIPFPVIILPAFGGALLGAFMLLVPEVWGTGYGWLQQAMKNELVPKGQNAWTAVLLLLGFAIAKAFATALTHGSRGGEGVFGPTFYFGGMLGAAYGGLVDLLWPEVVHDPWVYVLLGMGGVFAGVTKVPIAGLLMVIEISQTYSLLLPIILVSSVAYVLTGKFSVYESQVATRADSPVHRAKYVKDVLEGTTVGDVWRPGKDVETISWDMPLSEILKTIPYSHNNYFPVVNQNKEMIGILSLHDIRAILYEEHARSLIIAEDVATTDILTVTVNDSLNEALQKFALIDVEQLPVVEEDNEKMVRGFLSRRQVIDFYNNRLRDHLSRS